MGQVVGFRGAKESLNAQAFYTHHADNLSELFAPVAGIPEEIAVLDRSIPIGFGLEGSLWLARFAERVPIQTWQMQVGRGAAAQCLACVLIGEQSDAGYGLRLARQWHSQPMMPQWLIEQGTPECLADLLRTAMLRQLPARLIGLEL